MVKNVAILGAGNGGVTAAADLTSRGFSVRLYEQESFESNLKGIINNGGIKLIKKSTGDESFQVVDKVTTNIEDAINNADVVMITVPAFAIEAIAEKAAQYISEDQIILINGAASMGALRFVQAAKKIGVNKKFKIGELNSLTYGTRVNYEKAEVILSLEVKHLFFSAYVASETNDLIAKCKELYDYLVPAENLWHVLLANGNPEAHPPGVLLNAGRIEFSKGDFWLYKEGITPHTINVVLGVQEERLALGKAFGFSLDTAAVARQKRGYFSNSQNSLDRLFNESDVFKNIPGPSKLDNRYLTEDIPYGLVLWSDIGKAVGVETPVIDSIITLTCKLLEKDFWSTGITLETLGLDGLNKEELIRAVS